jgi:hypothetical protein
MPREHVVRVLSNEAVHEDYKGLTATIWLPDDLQGYAELWRTIEAVRARGADGYHEWKALMRLWSAGDWFFRLIFVLTAGRDAFNPFRQEPHFWHPAHLEIARWCQFGDHDNTYLVASRGLGKSTHLTLNDDIGKKILDPNHASVTFSHTREFAQKHMAIKMEELRKNALLKELWDDRFFDDPDEDAPLFSLKDGINIKRSSTRMEPSFSAHAFESALPVGSHYDKRYYDDIEVDATVESDERMDKVEGRYVSSQDLSSGQREKAVTGTYYHPNGPMRRLETKYGMTPKVWACEDPTRKPEQIEHAGPMGGTPINGFTVAELAKIIKDKGGKSSVLAMRSYGRQNLCDPLAGEASRLDKDFIRYYELDALEIGRRCYIYITQDPSPGLHDPTWTWVWGLHPDGNYYWLDGWRGRMTPARRLAETYLTGLKWSGIGHLVQYRIESFGQGGYAEAQAEYNASMDFNVEVLKVADNKVTKREREYLAWQPPLSEGKLRFPRHMVRPDHDGQPIDLVAYFFDSEFSRYPQPDTDDGLDGGGLLWAREQVAPPLEWPVAREQRVYQDLRRQEGGHMARGIL